MTNPVALIRHRIDHDGNQLGDALYLWCPGCNSAHSVNVSGSLDPLWDWDGNLESPTIAPSILCHSSVHLCERDHYAVNECLDLASCDRPGHSVTYDDSLAETGPHYWHGEPHTVDPAWGNCHSFVQGGHWVFLGDCAHALAGQTVPMVPIPDWMIG